MSKILRASTSSSNITDRQRRILGWDQKKIESATILVGGAGALGNEVAKNLALLNFKMVRIIDRDRVELTNLNRCSMFTLADVRRRRSKAEALARGLRRIRDISVTAFESDIRSIALSRGRKNRVYRGVDLAFGCFDNDGARRQMNQECWKYRIPLVDGGIDALDGTIATVLPPTPPCLECSLSTSEGVPVSCDMQYIPGVGPVMPAVSTTASVIGALMVSEGLKILMRDGNGWNEKIGKPLVGFRLMISISTNELGIMQSFKNPSCEVCSS